MIIVFTFSSEEEKNKFDYIFSRYKNLMLHKAYMILGDYGLAEDAVSEALIRIYRNIHKIQDPASNQSVAYIVTIVKNTALTLLEKEKRKVIGAIEEDIEDDYNLEQSVLSAIQAEDILRLLDQIGEDLKCVFLLKFGQDMSHKEIGRMLNISENNVTVRLHRARKKIASLLVKEGYVNEAETKPAI